MYIKGKVPALDTGSKVVVESVVISDYLDENYPNNPLYSKDSETKTAEKELIKKIDAVTTVFAKCVFGLEKKTPAEWLTDFLAVLEVFEKELAGKGTPLFGGDKPNMVKK